MKLSPYHCTGLLSGISLLLCCFAFGPASLSAQTQDKESGDMGRLNRMEIKYFGSEVAKSGIPPIQAQTFASLSQLAVDDYAAKRYHASADHLMQALQHNNQDARTYYRLGDVLTKLHDSDGAKEAYQAAFSVDPFGPIGAMAKQELLTRAHRAAYQASAPQDTPIVVAPTVSWINRQSDDLSSRYNREGRDWQRWRGYLAGIEAEKIRQQTQLQLANLNMNTNINNNFVNNNWRENTLGGGYGYHNTARHYGYGGGYGTNNAANQYDREEISNLGEIRANYVLTDGTVQGNKAMLEATTKAANVHESANNLKDLMLQPSKPGGLD